MKDYEITDFELNRKKTVVRAQGVAEAMLEYLPWPKLDVNIYFNFDGPYEVIDQYTDFKYRVEPV
jgi:hypothetical protein